MVKTMVSCRFSLKPIHWDFHFCHHQKHEFSERKKCVLMFDQVSTETPRNEKKHETSVSWDGKHMPLHTGSYVYILYVYIYIIYIYVCVFLHVFAILFSMIQGATYSAYWNATNFNQSCWGIICPHIQFLLRPTVKQIVWIVYRGRKRAHHKSWLK